MNSAFSCVKLARITLQLRSALSIGSGVYDALAVHALQRDANGLPVIPASALAGVWQGLLPDYETIFGDAALKGKDEKGMSALQISFAHIHAANNQVQDGWIDLAQAQADPILAPLLSSQAPRRDQVRLNKYGVVEGDGKFERSLVPAGHRFSFEIALWHSPEAAAQAQQAWLALHAALFNPAFRLGGATRSGLGSVQVQAWGEAEFDLRVAADVAKFASLPHRLDVPVPLLQPRAVASSTQCGYLLELEFLDYWRVGQGSESLLPLDDAGDKQGADLLPLTQEVVRWPTAPEQLAELKANLYLPASGIKGALRHRMEYYLHCLQMAASNNQPEQLAQQVASQIEAVFGNAADQQGGHAGILAFEDVLLALPGETELAAKPQRQHITHNSIDHFTQATRDGALFIEQMLYQGGFSCRVSLLAAADLSALQQQALELAFDDICQARLALGAASARGHGYLKGQWCAFSGDANG